MKPSDLINEPLTEAGMWDAVKSRFNKKPKTPAAEPKEPTMNPTATAQPGTVPSISSTTPSPTTGTGAYSRQSAYAPASTPTAAAPAASAKVNAPTYNVPTGNLPQVSATMPTGMQTTASSYTQAPAQQVAQPQYTDPEQYEPEYAEPEASAPSTTNAQKASNALKGAGSSIWQGVKDLFDPNARVARGANRTANAVRADAIKREVTDYQALVRGLDPSDVNGYQSGFMNWAKAKYPLVDDYKLADIAQTIDPKRPASITMAVATAYNDHMAQDAQMNPQTKHLMNISKQAKDTAMLKRFQQDLEDPRIRTAAIADKAMANPNLGGMIAPTTTSQPQVDELTPQTDSKEEAEVIDNLKTLKGTEQRLMQKLGDIRSQVTPAKAPKQMPTSGLPTPQEMAAHDAKVAAAAAAQPVSESKNFSAILWKQMRDSK